MPVIYDEENGGLAIGSENCGDCEEPLYDTGCDAPGCCGYCCMDCGTGCDIEFSPEDGRCAAALAEESDEDYAGRVNAERAAFGLSPLPVEPGQDAAPGSAGKGD
jgi:hypothetical protein